jgi:anthranilate synthase/aminodeoxychorismate synthase-like glutamine amidotransferase
VSARVLLIDNYDSFTFNVVQGFRMLGAEVDVRRNDEISVSEAEGLDFSHLVISPGPGEPTAAGISIGMIRAFAGRVPVLGVCLGHQSLVAAYGGVIVRAEKLMHGKTSEIYHDGKGLFAGLRQPFTAGRYHSLAARRKSLPTNLTVTANTRDGVIMGVRDAARGLEGVQFHPESVLTPDGQTMLGNFLAMSLASSNRPEPAESVGESTTEGGRRG